MERFEKLTDVQRRVFQAVALGATTTTETMSMAGCSRGGAVTGCARLKKLGLVQWSDEPSSGRYGWKRRLVLTPAGRVILRAVDKQASA